ncbi:MAG: hypothetical protein KDK04_09935 [Candidatus Competibacteraceae bacterium]|nr:hypothetical protein [Candidatus Competibacteraceae bacterium]
MPSLKDNVKTAVDSYPISRSLLRWRSSESQTATTYLRDQIARNIDDQTLRHILDRLLDGTALPAPLQGKVPGIATLRTLKKDGRLYSLLKQARDNSPALRAWKLAANHTLARYTASTKMANDPAARGIDLDLRRKYDLAIGNWGTYKPNSGNLNWPQIQQENLSALLGHTRAQHLDLISQIWTDMLILKRGDTEVQNMVDPAGGAFPSSQNLINAFKSHGYCFRCDTRQPADVAKNGFLRKYDFDPPEDIKETLPHKAAKGIGMPPQLGMWASNRDALSEMTICVARQMRGCTKFPSEGYAGPAWVYALKLPMTHKGFDTEHWQTQVGGLWQPGEKAFFAVPAAHILASVPIMKSMKTPGTSQFFRFQILSQTWTWHNATPQDKAHLNLELAALYNNGQVQAVMDDEDFLPGQ